MTRRPLVAGRADGPLRLDDAIDALLDGRAVLLSADGATDVELMATARLLHEELPRFHPRFSFEEHLADRLRAAGAAGPRVRRGTERMLRASMAPSSPPVDDATTVGPGPGRRRGIVAGGAIASGLSVVIPLAGAAVLVWRRSRPTGGLP